MTAALTGDSQTVSARRTPDALEVMPLHFDRCSLPANSFTNCRRRERRIQIRPRSPWTRGSLHADGRRRPSTVLMSARLAGMMNAPESPWQMRPNISSGTASAPAGAIATKIEPTMLRMNPHIRTFTRPTRSARPPITTMKIPENNAVIDTAIFMTLVATSRSAAIAGAMLRVVWANSQGDGPRLGVRVRTDCGNTHAPVYCRRASRRLAALMQDPRRMICSWLR